jgi:catechol 2,3-dioxygenase-like lactoylglutathione lyase family enzyme
VAEAPPPIELSHIDHFVIPCSDVEAVAAFYVRVLGMKRRVDASGRVAVHFGRQKFNLQHAGRETVIRAVRHEAGTQDFCLIVTTPLADVAAHLAACGVAVEEGPVTRAGAQGPMTSLYFRDPDDNLVELASYAPADAAWAAAQAGGGPAA